MTQDFKDGRTDASNGIRRMTVAHNRAVRELEQDKIDAVDNLKRSERALGRSISARDEAESKLEVSTRLLDDSEQSLADCSAGNFILMETVTRLRGQLNDCLNEPPVVEPPVRPPPVVEPPIVEPPVLPPPTGRWPRVEACSIEILMHGFRDMDVAVFPKLEDSDWTREPGWRFCVQRMNFDGRLAIAFYEQFEGFDATRATILMGDVFANIGAVLFDSIAFKYGREDIFRVQGNEKPGPDAIQVRGGLLRRYSFGPDGGKLDRYEHIQPEAFYQKWPWLLELAHKGLTTIGNSYHTETVGIYNLNDPQVIGSSSLNGSHGGYKVAPNHFGADGWQACSREGYMWAAIDMFSTFDRSPIGVFDPETLHPLNRHKPYWCGRANSSKPGGIEAYEGFAPDPDTRCSYLPKLEQFEAHDYTHGRRGNGSADFLAAKDIVGRFLSVEWYWADYDRWLDGGTVKPYDNGQFNGLLMPISQIIAQTKEAGRLGKSFYIQPNSGWSQGGRGFANALDCFSAAHRWFNPITRNDRNTTYEPEMVSSRRTKQTYYGYLQELIKATIRPNGILHTQHHDDNWPNVPNSARMREVQLLQKGLLFLGLHEEAGKAAFWASPTVIGSPPSAADSTSQHWAEGIHSENPNYYIWYDILMGFYDTIDLKGPLFTSPIEQQISLIPKEELQRRARL